MKYYTVGSGSLLWKPWHPVVSVCLQLFSSFIQDYWGMKSKSTMCYIQWPVFCVCQRTDLFNAFGQNQSLGPSRQRFNHVILSLFTAACFVLLFQLGIVSSRHMQHMSCGVIECIFVKFQTMEETSSEWGLQSQIAHTYHCWHILHTAQGLQTA